MRRVRRVRKRTAKPRVVRVLPAVKERVVAEERRFVISTSLVLEEMDALLAEAARSSASSTTVVEEQSRGEPARGRLTLDEVVGSVAPVARKEEAGEEVARQRRGEESSYRSFRYSDLGVKYGELGRGKPWSAVEERHAPVAEAGSGAGFDWLWRGLAREEEERARYHTREEEG